MNTGYILTSHYDDLGKKHLLRYLGVDQTGPFELIFDSVKPLFFIERDASLPNLPMRFERKKVELKTFQDRTIDALYFDTQRDLFQAREILQDSGVRTFESDIRPEERFLMERFINAAVDFEGTDEKMVKGVRQFHNPSIKPGNFKPQFSIISVDIETSYGDDLYSIGVHFEKGDEDVRAVFMVGDSRETRGHLELFPSEKEVYLAFMELFRRLDPDLIVGWHVVGFDMRFLERKCEKWGIDFSWGRKGTKAKLIEGKGMGMFARMEGRVVVDGPPAMRAAFYKFEDFKLQTVSKALLGSGKDIQDEGGNKVEEIERRFREDKDALAKYNLMDCTLVLAILEKTGLIDLMYTRTIISGMLMDRIGSSAAAFDHFLLPRIHRKGFVGPNTIDIQRDVHSAGGYVLEPVVGLHENVIVLDFKSLYPSIIRTFKIDPYSRLMSHVDPLSTPVGVSFSRTHHILPEFIEILMEKRAEAKAHHNPFLSQAIKILMNSFYGVMGSSGSRFYHADLPSSITGTGQWILKKSIEYLGDHDYQVIYGDTDSVFILLKNEELKDPAQAGESLAVKLNDFLRDLIKQSFKVESELDIEFEKYYPKFFLPFARSGEGGAKKRYAGVMIGPDGQRELQFSGMEIVRSDWTKVAKRFQRGLFERLFSFNIDEEIDVYIRNFVVELRSGQYDDELVYKKRLTKNLSEYTKSHPPHVKAALQLEQSGIEPGRSISYVMTRMGPVPVQLEHSDVDYNHYIEKQLKPLADSILGIFEQNFDSIVGGDQLSLF